MTRRTEQVKGNFVSEWFGHRVFPSVISKYSRLAFRSAIESLPVPQRRNRGDSRVRQIGFVERGLHGQQLQQRSTARLASLSVSSYCA